MLINPADRYPLVVGGEGMQRVQYFGVGRVGVIVRDDEINVLLVLACDPGAVLERLLHVFFL